MAYDPQRELDMTPDGEFRAAKRSPLSAKIIAYAVVVAVMAGAFAMAALALWVALALIPVVFAAVLVIVLTMRFRMWRARRSFSRERNIRPL